MKKTYRYIPSEQRRESQTIFNLIDGVSLDLEEVPCLRKKISLVIPVDATKARRREDGRGDAMPLDVLLYVLLYEKFDVPTTVDKNEGREASLPVLFCCMIRQSLMIYFFWRSCDC